MQFTDLNEFDNKLRQRETDQAFDHTIEEAFLVLLKGFRSFVFGVFFLSLLGTEVHAAKKLNLYCSVAIEWCQLLKSRFEEETGIRVSMTRKSSGETFAQIKAERKNPKGDVWFGGTGDPHLQAAEENLTSKIKTKTLSELHPWAKRQFQNSENKAIGVYAGALGFAVNKEWLNRKKIPLPKTWKDLIKPIYRGEIQMPNPFSSGTAYTALATFVQLYGEKEGFEYLKALHKNINQYTKSGSAPAKAASRGETGIGISFAHDIVTQIESGFPIDLVIPTEGTGYEVGSMSVIRGGRHPKEAQKFANWVLSPRVQSWASDVRGFQTPSNLKAKAHPKSPDLKKIKLIEYDFKTFGSKETRSRLLAKWKKEVHSQER